MKKLIFIGLMLFNVNSYGQAGTPITDFETWFMPGVGYSVYMPEGYDTSGYYQGFTVEYLFFARINQTQSWGPSHTRVYGKFNIMNAPVKELNDIFMYGAGIDFSLERNPKRNFIIPYFGLECGALSQKSAPTTMMFSSTLGLRLIALKNLMFNVHGAYIYPVNYFDALQGFYVQSTVNFSLW